MKKIQLLSVIAIVSVLYSCKEEDKVKNSLGEADVIPVKISAVSALGIPKKNKCDGPCKHRKRSQIFFQNRWRH